jgi:hypothetical protein
MAKPYFDHQHGQWVGEHDTRDDEGEVSRQTEWFDTYSDAKEFVRSGRIPCDERLDLDYGSEAQGIYPEFAYSGVYSD